ncbi:hypothetical protein FSP39_016820 [Pinctada imbricata]|uniref:Fibrinogen C-terminal domain-containing protein n=1 Tax=Pinctada imbricata TaxID=66713 RepID=A0AA88Y4A9_PINIB|nr:hypothetical protein FSP39_016820 [Pinctada imbricata]
MRTSGVYQIRPRGAAYVESIYCEFVNDTAYNVIQRRFDGLLDFERGWVEYKYGFGSLYGDHWLGNEIAHLLSNQRHYNLRIDLWDWEGGRAYAEYSVFSVDNEANKYTLKVSGYSGNAGDSLSYHNGLKFSTEDNDNDVNIRSCAKDNKSGWWFESCFLANLNGVYRKGWYTHKQSSTSDGIVWYTLKNTESYSLKKVEMKMYRAS